MFEKFHQLVWLSLLVLILQCLDVSSNIDEFPMSGHGHPAGSESSGNSINNGASASRTTSGHVWSSRQVHTKLGTVQGYIVTPPNGYNPAVEVFLNLPYASSPEGTLRFMPPVSGSPWNGVRRSENPSPVCPQVLPNIRNESEALKMMPRGRLTYLRRLLPHLRNQSEDCLYLNVYVPVGAQHELEQGNKLPVMVFVHGEDYGYGAGHPYDPTMLVSQGNIIAVTMNYRLGILGFLNADADGHFKLPFNFALLDQIAALQWVQENIEVFGGDRRRVTLMGHGKGAVCVNFLMISNAVPTGLLFHRVILSSGSALSPVTADLSKGPELARKFARKVKCPTEPSSTMLQCLRELPLKFFLESELWNLFGPTGDGIVVKHTLPSESVIMNRISHYPLIFGVVRAEFLPALNNHDATYGLESERRRELLRQFIRKHYSFHRNEILAGAIHEYTDWEKPAQHPLNVRDETIDALADAQVVAPLTKIGDLHAASSRTKAYFYVFDYQSKNSDYQQRLGCVHGEDLFYIFGVPLYYYENEFATASSSSSSMLTGATGDNNNNNHSPASSDHAGDTMISATGKTGGDQQQLLLLRKESRRKRAERMALGFFAGNFTWYEVQLSATVIQLWANFIRTGNPNGDVKSSGVKVAHGMGLSSSSGKSNTYQQQQQQQQQQHSEPLSLDAKSPPFALPPSSAGAKSWRKVRGDSEAKEAADLLLLYDHTDNRLRLSRDNLEEELQQQQQLHHHQQHLHQQPKPIFVDWPEYDSLDKKYLILDLRPRVRNHYRAHKLSFWLHLVPDYQKNSEGTSAISIHHELNMYHSPGMVHPSQNLSSSSSKLSVIHPTIFASGLHDPPAVGLSSSKTRHNSSATIDSASGSGGTGKKRGSNSNNRSSRNKGAAQRDELAEERQKQQDSAILHTSGDGTTDPLDTTYGFHTYSTALSVTIAIGCSLLILNILIFATFYYEREKRRQEHRRQKQLEREEDEPAPHNHHHQADAVSLSSCRQIFRQQSSSSDRHPIPLTTTSIIGSTSASLKRRRDNNGATNAASSVVHPLSPPPPPLCESTTVFCEHYLDDENDDNPRNMQIFSNDLYHNSVAPNSASSSTWVAQEHSLHPLGLLPPPEDLEVAAVTSSSELKSDMSYVGKYGRKQQPQFGTEHGFIPISPAPTAGAIHQKRKAFANGTGNANTSSSSSGVAGGLNEFSMSGVIAEPITNVANFSPQPARTTHGAELLEIERIPTVEELIEAEAAQANGSSTTIQLVIVPPPPPSENSPSEIVPPAEIRRNSTGQFFQD